MPSGGGLKSIREGGEPEQLGKPMFSGIPPRAATKVGVDANDFIKVTEDTRNFGKFIRR